MSESKISEVWAIDLKDRRDIEISLIYSLIFAFVMLLFLALFWMLHSAYEITGSVLEIFSIFGFLGAIVGFFLIRALISPFVEDNRKLDNLLKEMIHELNIPVSTILANSAMLKKELGEKKQQRRLERIELAAKNLSKQYENLEFEIRSQIKRPKIEEFYLDELVKEAVLLFGDIKKVAIELDMEPCRVQGDRLGCLKVVTNLIDNAIKYSNEGGVVKVSIKENLLKVQDSGVGIRDDEILRIFDRYYQSDSSIKGCGIGLGYVKEFCDEHGIEIRIASEVGRGSEFALLFESR